MSAFRAVFFFYYGRGLDFAGLMPDIVRAFYIGVRLDASVAAIASIPVTLAFVVFLFIGNPIYFKKFFSAAKFYYTAVFGLFLTLLCVDFGFYSYFQDRLNIMVFGLIEDDTMAILTTIYKNYNVFAVIAGFVLLFVLAYFISKVVLKTVVAENGNKSAGFRKIIIKNLFFSCHPERQSLRRICSSQESRFTADPSETSSLRVTTPEFLEVLK